VIEVRAPALAFVDPTEPEDRPLANVPDLPGLPSISLPDPPPAVERPQTPGERARATVQADRSLSNFFRRTTKTTPGGSSLPAGPSLEDGGEGAV
jgi:hypothetical protein